LNGRHNELLFGWVSFWAHVVLLVAGQNGVNAGSNVAANPMRRIPAGSSSPPAGRSPCSAACWSRRPSVVPEPTSTQPSRWQCDQPQRRLFAVAEPLVGTIARRHVRSNSYGAALWAPLVAHTGSGRQARHLLHEMPQSAARYKRIPSSVKPSAQRCWLS